MYVGSEAWMDPSSHYFRLKKHMYSRYICTWVAFTLSFYCILRTFNLQFESHDDDKTE